MPNPYHQHVLEQDANLPAPLRWLTRAMSSWWTIGVLSVLVAGYLAFAFVTPGGRHLWQSRLIDSTRQDVLSWWPLQVAMLLLALAALWSATRRLPMRWANLGAYIAVLGLAITLASQSIAWRYQTTGVIAVPISQPSEPGKPVDPARLNYTTRYGDTSKRMLVINYKGEQIPVSLDRLPRWNDAAGAEMPVIDIHLDSRLRQSLGFDVTIRPVAYVAHGELTDNPDGTQTVTPTPVADRKTTALPYPDKALVAIQFAAVNADRSMTTTTAWLPFEPAGTDTFLPSRYFKVDGLGKDKQSQDRPATVGLAFRPKSERLEFAIGVTYPQAKKQLISLHIADSNTEGKLLQPASYHIDFLHGSPYRFLTDRAIVHQVIDDDKQIKTIWLDWIGGTIDSYALVSARTGPPYVFIYTGLGTLLLGLVLIGCFELRSRLQRYGKEPNAEQRRHPA